MRQKTINIYKFRELLKGSKARASQDHREICGYSWQSEMNETMERLVRHFNCSINTSYIDLDSMDSAIHIESTCLPTRETIQGLLNDLGTFDSKNLRGHGSCVLTGCFTDEEAIDGFREAFNKGEENIHKLLKAAFKSLIKACKADYTNQYLNKNFSETCEANKYEFYENGEMF